MKNKTSLIKLLTVFFGIIFLIISAFSWYYIPIKTGKSADDILKIEVVKGGGFFSKTSEYIIDFTDNTLIGSVDGETFYSSFSEENKNSFIKTANLYGFFDWEEYYVAQVYDAPNVNVNIIYTDGSEQDIYFLGMVAPNYEQIRNAFNDNFGYFIL